MAFGRDQLLRWLSPGVVRQCGAMPYRWQGGLELLLVTSGSGRWIVPKGWPKLFQPAFKAAEVEAFEEAGVRGRIERRPLGTFDHLKSIGRDQAVRCRVTTFALEVGVELAEWPEQRRRRRRWVDVLEAKALVDNPGLAVLIDRLGARIAPEPSGKPAPAIRA